MRIGTYCLAAFSLFACACGRHENSEPGKPIAYRVGEAAHSVAKETGKAAAVAGRKLAEGAKEAGAGWKEAARKEKDKERP